MKTALDTMGVMQTEWDAAVEANQAELRQIRADAIMFGAKQTERVDA